MKSYSLVVKRMFIADGREYHPGEVIGSVAAHIDFGTLMSVTGPADRVVAIDDEEVDYDDVPLEDVPPGATAADDDDADPGPELDPTDVIVEPAVAIEGQGEDSLLLAGIPERAAEVLRENGLDNLEAVLQWLADGNDLIDLDGIGPKLKDQTLTALGV